MILAAVRSRRYHIKLQTKLVVAVIVAGYVSYCDRRFLKTYATSANANLAKFDLQPWRYGKFSRS